MVKLTKMDIHALARSTAYGAFCESIAEKSKIDMKKYRQLVTGYYNANIKEFERLLLAGKK